VKDTIRGIFSLVLAAVVLGISLPFVIFAWRVAESWTHNDTAQLLGACLAALGAVATIVAMLVGAGAYKLLAGRREREVPPPPPVVVLPPETFDSRPQLPARPPWGVTGGGQYTLLPGPEQMTSNRFQLEREMESLPSRRAGQRQARERR
jgi:hypothetical protein